MNKNQHICEICMKKEGCKNYENIVTQPKLTLCCCVNYKKVKKSK